jgi:hypothetical protein
MPRMMRGSQHHHIRGRTMYEILVRRTGRQGLRIVQRSHISPYPEIIHMLSQKRMNTLDGRGSRVSVQRISLVPLMVYQNLPLTPTGMGTKNLTFSAASSSTWQEPFRPRSSRLLARPRKLRSKQASGCASSTRHRYCTGECQGLQLHSFGTWASNLL